MNRRQPRTALFYAVSYSVVPQLVFGAISDLPAAQFMRNTLHLDAKGFALLSTLCGLPVYATPVYGYVRDRWSPLKMGDRGFLVLLPLLALAGFWGIASLPFGYGVFLVGAWLVVTANIFLNTVLYGAGVAIVKKYNVSSFYVSLLNFSNALVGALFALAGGWAALHIPYRFFLFLMGLGCLSLSLYGLFKPKNVDLPHVKPSDTSLTPLSEVKRLIKCKPYMAILVFTSLWGIDLTGGTVMLFFMQDKLHGSMQNVAEFQAIQSIVGWIGVPLYALFAVRFRAKSMLLAGVALAIFQYLPLILTHSMMVAYLVGAIISLTNYAVNLPNQDLQIRHCPKGLEGLGTAMLSLVIGLVASASTIAGGWVYGRYGFNVTIYLSTGFSLCCIPFLIFIKEDPSIPVDENDDAVSPLVTSSMEAVSTHA